MRISEGKGKIKVAHAEIFTDLPPHYDAFQLMRILQHKFNYQPYEARNLVSTNYWANLSNIDIIT